MTMIPDFSKSYFRFYIDFEGMQAEFIINAPMAIGLGVSANHYSRPRHVEPTRNTLFAVGNP